MSMSTHINAIKPGDEYFHKMKAAYEACKIANIQIPSEILEFFNYQDPDDNGVIIDQDNLPNDCFKEYSTNYQQGYDVYIDKLPKDVKIIRFYNSW